jgi:hypothetical protein
MLIQLTKFVVKSRKGIDMPIKAVSLIILGLLIVAFLYAGYNTWFGDIAGGFVGSVEYPSTNTG